MWSMEVPGQFSLGQTVQSLTCSIMENPHTGLDDWSEYATLLHQREDTWLRRRFSHRHQIDEFGVDYVILGVWGLPYMTSAKYPDFFTPSASCHKSADVPFVCFLGTPPPTHCGRHIWKPPIYLSLLHLPFGHSEVSYGWRGILQCASDIVSSSFA